MFLNFSALKGSGMFMDTVMPYSYLFGFLGKTGQNFCKFLLYDLECYFLNYVDVQLIIEFNNSLGKFCPVFLKILKGRFFGHPV